MDTDKRSIGAHSAFNSADERRTDGQERPPAPPREVLDEVLWIIRTGPH